MGFVLIFLCNGLSVFAQKSDRIEKLLGEQKLSGVVWTLVKHDSVLTFSAGKRNLATGEKLLVTDKVLFVYGLIPFAIWH